MSYLIVFKTATQRGFFYRKHIDVMLSESSILLIPTSDVYDSLKDMKLGIFLNNVLRIISKVCHLIQTRKSYFYQPFYANIVKISI